MQNCTECLETWWDSYWGEQCCDLAWDQWGFDAGKSDTFSSNTSRHKFIIVLLLYIKTRA